VTLHAALTPSSARLIDARALSLMREDAILINTARGGLVDEAALFEALSAGQIAGACLDVFSTEPPLDSPLLGLENVLVTPHIGGSTEEAILEMGRAAILGLDSAVHPAREGAGLQ
jgi:D-3-phosphoglycerate dehydrogenase